MKKFLITLLILILAAGVFAGYFYKQFTPSPNPEFGLSYSTEAAKGLGFDPKQEYLDILDDLKPKKLRLTAYWDQIESKQGQYDFTLMDQLLQEADKRNLDVILVLGHKEPRWPECHQPDWYNGLSKDQQDTAVISMLTDSVNHFKKFKSIKVWQVENEPFFGFGPQCPEISGDLVKKEIQTVKGIDLRPVMLTDSGEKGSWLSTVKVGADILGTTMYRIVVDKNFGYEKYPIPPAYYRINAGIVEKFAGPKKIIGAELQAEPWVTSGFEQVDVSEQLTIMNPKVLLENVDYARRVGFGENYLWGVEWWYWLAKKKNDWGMWDTAKKVINGSL